MSYIQTTKEELMTIDMKRTGSISCKTKETSIDVTVRLDEGLAQIETGIGFFDHMLDQLAPQLDGSYNQG